MIVEYGFLNDVFDVISKKPVNKFELLEYFSKEHGLKYEIIDTQYKSATGSKLNYYSLNDKIKIFGFNVHGWPNN